jgi:hypothetical protein
MDSICSRVWGFCLAVLTGRPLAPSTIARTTRESGRRVLGDTRDYAGVDALIGAASAQTRSKQSI